MGYTNLTAGTAEGKKETTAGQTESYPTGRGGTSSGGFTAGGTTVERGDSREDTYLSTTIPSKRSEKIALLRKRAPKTATVTIDRP